MQRTRKSGPATADPLRAIAQATTTTSIGPSAGFDSLQPRSPTRRLPANTAFARWCSNRKPSAPKCQSSHSHTPRSYATKIRSCCWARASVRESVVGCRLLATMLSPTPWARSSARPQSGGRPSCSPMDPPRRGTRRASMSDRASGTPLTPAPQSHSPHAHDARRRWPRRSPQATLSFAARPASS